RRSAGKRGRAQKGLLPGSWGAVRFGSACKPSGMPSRLPRRSDSKRLPGHARDVLWRNSAVRSGNRGPERSRRPGQLLNTPQRRQFSPRSHRGKTVSKLFVLELLGLLLSKKQIPQIVETI